jgi:hypothetical protein
MYNRQAITITTLLVLTLIAVTTLAGSLMILRAPPIEPRPEPARVEYRFIGTAARAAITFRNDENQIEQREISPPGNYRFRSDPGRELLIEIRRLSESGAVGCAIIIERQVREEQPADEDRATATCRVQLP